MGLTNQLRTRMLMYEHDQAKAMSTTAVAQMLSNTLYYRRFFPYYTFNVLAGVQNGVGKVYSYDAIGSFEEQRYSTSGTGSALLMSILDTALGWKLDPENQKQLTQDQAVDLVRNVLSSAAERDIYTGDCAEVCVITDEG